MAMLWVRGRFGADEDASGAELEGGELEREDAGDMVLVGSQLGGRRGRKGVGDGDGEERGACVATDGR